MDRLRLKNDSKLDIQYRIWEGFLPFLIILLITWTIDIFSTVANRTGNHDVYIAFTVISSVMSIVWFFLRFPIYVGISRYFLHFIAKEAVGVGSIFSDLTKAHVYWEELKAYVATAFLTLLGLICFIVPGIYLALLYSQLPFIFAEHPEYTAGQAIARTKQLMRGRTLELFGLWFSFILWYLLVAVTFGIASIYVAPYTACAYTRYYKSLCFLVGDASGVSGGYRGPDDQSGSDFSQNRYYPNGQDKKENENGGDGAVNAGDGTVSGTPFDEMK